MSGHSHWSSIKHKKAQTDNRRGKHFSKLAKNITSAARTGGGKPEDNLRLRYAIDKAKQYSMPRENIERAVKTGTGEIKTDKVFEEIVYEGYGPGGVALKIDIFTENRNRTAPEIRKVFERFGGQLGATGCVGWMFHQKGVIGIPVEGNDEDKVMEAALEAGAENMERAGEVFEVTTTPHSFEEVRKALETAGFKIEMAEVTQLPENFVKVDAKHAKSVMALMEALDEQEDVLNVYSNADFPEDMPEE
jgi:YebC/PmpR family DNA-binding regulatory protein